MSSNITITWCKQGYKEFAHTVLVRGIGKRTVLVILRSNETYSNEPQVIIDAAKLASKNGWRKIVVTSGNCVGSAIRGFNLHQYFHGMWNPRDSGIFLGYVQE